MLPWPALPLDAWRDTCVTLHMWTQIVGKVRLALTPRTNHWWNVPLYVNARGLTSSPIPFRERSFEVLFDFVQHNLVIETSDGEVVHKPLRPQPVAEFYADFMQRLRALGIDVRIWPKPVEVPDPIPFAEDTVHRSYDPEYANRFWHVLLSADALFKRFRAGFCGKCSPVHFFWGSFDLAVTRFSGRRAPERPDADAITREAYSHEVLSAGWWPGGGQVNDAAFYAYAAPEPSGFSTARVKPNEAFYQPNLREFILMYENARRTASPDQVILDFLQSTYEAGAELAGWDRDALEVRAA